jgi:hypothetical protein
MFFYSTTSTVVLYSKCTSAKRFLAGKVIYYTLDKKRNEKKMGLDKEGGRYHAKHESS